MNVAKPTHSVLASAVLLALATLSTTSALAQQAPPVEEEEQATTLSAITVTAQKRVEQLQDVPIAVTALDEQLLQYTGVRDI